MSSSPTAWSSQLWALHAEVAGEVAQSTLWSGMVNGTLPSAPFLGFQADDLLYNINVTDAIKGAATRCRAVSPPFVCDELDARAVW